MSLQISRRTKNEKKKSNLLFNWRYEAFKRYSHRQRLSAEVSQKLVD